MKRSEVGTCVLQRSAQQAREPDDHCLRNFGIAINERGNTLQSVKQKMRMQLDSQSLKFARGQRLLQFAALQFFLPSPLEIFISMGGNHNGEVDHDLIRESGAYQPNEGGPGARDISAQRVIPRR